MSGCTGGEDKTNLVNHLILYRVDPFLKLSHYLTFEINSLQHLIAHQYLKTLHIQRLAI